MQISSAAFVVRLPIAPVTSLAPRAPVMITGTRAKERFRVLVVDDNLDTAESLGMLVNAAGYDVRTVHDGPTALQVASDYQPNAVLLDIGLPGLDAMRSRNGSGSNQDCSAF